MFDCFKRSVAVDPRLSLSFLWICPMARVEDTSTNSKAAMGNLADLLCIYCSSPELIRTFTRMRGRFSQIKLQSKFGQEVLTPVRRQVYRKICIWYVEISGSCCMCTRATGQKEGGVCDSSNLPLSWEGNDGVASANQLIVD